MSVLFYYTKALRTSRCIRWFEMISWLGSVAVGNMWNTILQFVAFAHNYRSCFDHWQHKNHKKAVLYLHRNSQSVIFEQSRVAITQLVTATSWDVKIRSILWTHGFIGQRYNLEKWINKWMHVSFRKALNFKRRTSFAWAKGRRRIYCVRREEATEWPVLCGNVLFYWDNIMLVLCLILHFSGKIE